MHLVTSRTRLHEGASILGVVVTTLLGLLAFLEPLHDLGSGQLPEPPAGDVIFVTLQTEVFGPECLHRCSWSSFSFPFLSWLPGYYNHSVVGFSLDLVAH